MNIIIIVISVKHIMRNATEKCYGVILGFIMRKSGITYDGKCGV